MQIKVCASTALCPEWSRRSGRARGSLARDLEPCADRVMETISEDAEAELELGNYSFVSLKFDV